MKFDFKSLKFKLWFSFALFAILLMGLLWCLQFLFFQAYYQEMKTNEIVKIADEIATDYGQLDLEKMQEYSYSDDVFIQLETDSGIVVYTPTKGNLRPSIMGNAQEMATIRERLLSSADGTVSYTLGDSDGDRTTLVYGKRIAVGQEAYVNLYIYAPLSPVQSTIEILANQLIWVTIISLLLAFTLSFFLSRRITRPLTNITDSAAKLAEGQYGITFEGGDYSEIVRLADTLTYTSGELAKAETLQKDLLANVSHDLRTPLTMVRSYAEMIRDLSGDDPEKRGAHLQVIIDEADRLNLLVSDMMALSQMQSGVVALETEQFSLWEAAESIVASYRVLEEQEGYHFIMQYESPADGKGEGSGDSPAPGPEDALVQGDPRKIKQVLSNLITNALRYGGTDKQVLIRITEKPRTVLCTVTDHGRGISEEELRQIWKRYYKSSANLSRNISGGSGLGLAITKEILTLHKARFGVKSRLGEGSSFWFELKK